MQICESLASLATLVILLALGVELVWVGLVRMGLVWVEQGLVLEEGMVH